MTSQDAKKAHTIIIIIYNRKFVFQREIKKKHTVKTNCQIYQYSLEKCVILLENRIHIFIEFVVVIRVGCYAKTFPILHVLLIARIFHSMPNL